MKVGLVLPQAGQQATRENVVQMAKNAESEGFDSLWVFEVNIKINEGQRFPFTGTIDQIGDDIKRTKQMNMDIDHIIFGYNFIPIGRDVNKMLDITKQLTKFAR